MDVSSKVWRNSERFGLPLAKIALKPMLNDIFFRRIQLSCF